jgi:hypothetical protein
MNIAQLTEALLGNVYYTLNLLQRWMFYENATDIISDQIHKTIADPTTDTVDTELIEHLEYRLWALNNEIANIDLELLLLYPEHCWMNDKQYYLQWNIKWHYISNYWCRNSLWRLQLKNNTRELEKKLWVLDQILDNILSDPFHSDTHLAAFENLANLLAEELHIARLELERISYLTDTPKTPVWELTDSEDDVTWVWIFLWPSHLHPSPDTQGWQPLSKSKGVSILDHLPRW